METIDEYQTRRRKEIKATTESLKKTGIECPNCKKAEMINPTPDIILTSHPPRKSVECPLCSYRTTVLA